MIAFAKFIAFFRSQRRNNGKDDSSDRGGSSSSSIGMEEKILESDYN